MSNKEQKARLDDLSRLLGHLAKRCALVASDINCAKAALEDIASEEFYQDDVPLVTDKQGDVIKSLEEKSND